MLVRRHELPRAGCLGDCPPRCCERWGGCATTAAGDEHRAAAVHRLVEQPRRGGGVHRTPATGRVGLVRVRMRAGRAASSQSAEALIRSSAYLPMARSERIAAAAALIGLLLAAPVLLSIFVGTNGLARVHLWLAAYVALLTVPFIRSDERLGLVHPVVLTALFAAVPLLRRLPVYIGGLDWHRSIVIQGSELSWLLERQLALESLAFAVYLLGYFALRKPRVVALDQPSGGRLVRVGVIAVCLGAFGLVLATSVGMGGISERVAEFGGAGGRHRALGGDHYLLKLLTIGAAACLLWLSGRVDAAKDGRFWVCAVLALVTTYLATGSRASVVYLLVSGIIVWMVVHRKRALRAGTVAVVVGFGALGLLGSLQAGAGQPGHTVSAQSLVRSAVNADETAKELVGRATTADGSLPIYAAVPNRVGYLKGESYAALLALPIPREWWDDKPGLIDGRVGRVFFGSPGGVPPGSVGESYWNFGILGVILAHFLFGVFHRWLAATVIVNGGHYAVRAVYAVIIVHFSEPLTSGLVGALPLVAMVWVLYRLAHRAK